MPGRGRPRFSSGSLHSDRYDDIYFSSGGGLEEKKYVFFDQAEVFNKSLADDGVTIAELGFGSGLSFAATMRGLADGGGPCRYFSCDEYLFSADEFQKMAGLFPGVVDIFSALATRVSRAETMQVIEWPGYDCELYLFHGNVNSFLKTLSHYRGLTVDAWYLDGFSPSKNPGMWNKQVLSMCASLSKSGTTFATYSTAGAVRRRLVSLGFSVEKRTGFKEKRQMLAGKLIHPPPGREAPWFSLPEEKPVGRSIIIGAGIAGCSLAYSLAKRGHEVLVIDKDEVACAASGNAAGVVYPSYEHRQPRDSILSQSYNYLKSSRLLEHDYVISHGIKWKGKENLGEGAAIKPGEFCRWLLKSSKAVFLGHTEIMAIQLTGDSIRVEHNNGTCDADRVFICHGGLVESLNFGLPFRGSEGMTMVVNRSIATTTCEKNLYGIPLDSETSLLGVSSVSAFHDPSVESLGKMRHLYAPGPVILHTRNCLRSSLPDFLPAAGPLNDAAFFETTYASINRGFQHHRYEPARYLPGLYVFAGFAGRGLTLAPFMAEMLAAQVSGEIPLVDTDYISRVHPARFQVKRLMKGISNSEKGPATFA